MATDVEWNKRHLGMLDRLYQWARASARAATPIVVSVAGAISGGILNGFCSTAMYVHWLFKEFRGYEVFVPLFARGLAIVLVSAIGYTIFDVVGVEPSFYVGKIIEAVIGSEKDLGQPL